MAKIKKSTFRRISYKTVRENKELKEYTKKEDEDATKPSKRGNVPVFE